MDQIGLRKSSPGITRLIALAAVLVVPLLVWVGLTPGNSRGDASRQVASVPAERPAITGDLEAVNQNGDTVRLSSLAGKVWVVAEFFAMCPLCARRSAMDLKSLADKFAGRSDFHIVCISVDPEADGVERLAGYAEGLGADAENWWFLTGEPAAVHRYLEDDLRFLPVRERTDPAEIETLGRFTHDMGIMVVDRRMRIVGKRDLTWAAEQGEELRRQWERHLHGIVHSELDAEI